MLNKYLTHCPNCAAARHKKHLKTCSVIEFSSGQSLKCFHCGMKKFVGSDDKIELKGEFETVQVKEAIAIPHGEFPVEDPAITYHPYYRGDTLIMYVARKGTGDDKWIRPFILTEDGWMMSDTKGPFLYRSEHLDKDSNKPVLVVEGEKAADRAAEIFTKCDVVSWKGGVANIGAGDWDLISGRRVVLWPDNDAVGIKAMEDLSKILKSPDISLVRPTLLQPKQDLADSIPQDILIQLWNSREKISRPTIRGAVEGDISSKFQDIQEGLSLGWPSFDKIAKLPTHGLVVIPGRTNHGKSLFMINIMANLLQQADVACIYLSYEMPNEDILLRLVKTLHGEKFEPIGYMDDLVYKEKIRDNAIPAVGIVDSYIKSGRLHITDQDISVKEIEETVRYLHSIKKKIVVFLDYIQLIPSGAGRSERYLEVKHTVEKFRQLANELKFVVIGGSQLTSGETPYQDQARESKDIAFTAALIIKIWNKESARVTGTVKMVQDPDNPRGEKIEEDYYDGTPGTFVAEIIKSRQGSLGSTVGFNNVNGCKLVEARIQSKGGF